MKKIFLSIIVFCLLSIIFVPLAVSAQTSQGLVKCGNDAGSQCTLQDFLTMVNDIYTFIVYTIATPLAIIALIIGGILMMTSAGNPNMMSTGKKVFWSAIIGLALAFGAKAIINFALTVIGYSGQPVQ